jgi:TRAP-type C4-dicarboxylate transport system permease small subunit
MSWTPVQGPKWIHEGPTKKEMMMNKQISNLDKLNLFCNWLNEKVTLAASAILFFMLVLAGITIFWRYVLNRPLIWGGDILLSSFIYVCLLGASIAFRQAIHVNVDSMINLLSKKRKIQLSIFTQSVITAFCGFLLVEGVKMVMATTDFRWGGLDIPPTYFYISFPLALLLMFLYGLDDTLQKIKRYREFIENKER